MEYVKATRTTHINKKYWFWVARARGEGGGDSK